MEVVQGPEGLENPVCVTFYDNYKDGEGGPTPAEGEVTEMPFTEDVNLYAHWEALTEISSAQELMDMNKNLYGYYVLKNDIDLSDMEFTPDVTS